MTVSEEYAKKIRGMPNVDIDARMGFIFVLQLGEFTFDAIKGVQSQNQSLISQNAEIIEQFEEIKEIMEQNKEIIEQNEEIISILEEIRDK